MLFSNYRKTIKATLTLMPLLGLPEVIFITPYHPSLKPAFELISAFLVSTQVSKILMTRICGCFFPFAMQIRGSREMNESDDFRNI